MIENKSASNTLKSAMNDIRSKALKYFDRSMIIREPYIFQKDNIDLYPHKLHRQLLKFGYEESDEKKK